MRAPHLHLHASLCLIGVPHVMRRPASVTPEKICAYGPSTRDGNRWVPTEICGHALFHADLRMREASEPNFKFGY